MDAALLDSHCHLTDRRLLGRIDEVVARARAAGLAGMITVGCGADDSAAAEALADRFADIWFAAAIHPHDAGSFSPELMAAVAARLGHRKAVAVGEIGLDYHYDFSPQEAQRRALRVQLAFAERAGLPVILHSRLAGPDIIAAVDGERFGRGGILHCFTEDWPIASAMLDRGFLISFSGILTFPKAGALREVAARVPLDRLLVETDSPYLAPVPYRGAGRRNEPAYVVETARVLAGLKGLVPEDLAEATTRNFAGLFPFENAAGR